jgi:hypothetical protein
MNFSDGVHAWNILKFYVMHQGWIGLPPAHQAYIHMQRWCTGKIQGGKSEKNANIISIIFSFPFPVTLILYFNNRGRCPATQR